MSTAEELQLIPSFDEEGFLIESSYWNPVMAQQIATLNGIPGLTNDHWRIIEDMREHYSRYHTPPVISHLCRLEGENRQWVHDLFGTCLNAWRVAGLPDPGEEAKAYLNDM
jgi:tRNA 2-thiouridine synthesizing protein E